MIGPNMSGPSSPTGQVFAPLRINSLLTLPVVELSWRFSRSSGPGGQGVNTADSRVKLIWNAERSEALAALPEVVRARFWQQIGHRLVDGQVTVAASEFRSQLRNRVAARERLASIVYRAMQPPPAPRKPTKPSRGAVERRIAGKKARSVIKASRAKPSTE